MKEYLVDWAKTYVATGTEKVSASSSSEAEGIVWEKLGDLEGSMQYYPDENSVEARLDK